MCLKKAASSGFKVVGFYKALKADVLIKKFIHSCVNAVFLQSLFGCSALLFLLVQELSLAASRGRDGW